MRESETDKGSVIRRDLYIWAAVIVIGAALLLIYFFTGKTGNREVVSVDGKEIRSYSLSDEVDEVITGFGGKGSNRLIIHGGEAFLESADCPDKLCVKQGKISKINQSIICLPHKLTVTIKGGKEGEVDAIVH